MVFALLFTLFVMFIQLMRKSRVMNDGGFYVTQCYSHKNLKRRFCSFIFISNEQHVLFAAVTSILFWHFFLFLSIFSFMLFSIPIASFATDFTLIYHDPQFTICSKKFQIEGSAKKDINQVILYILFSLRFVKYAKPWSWCLFSIWIGKIVVYFALF